MIHCPKCTSTNISKTGTGKSTLLMWEYAQQLPDGSWKVNKDPNRVSWDYRCRDCDQHFSRQEESDDVS